MMDLPLVDTLRLAAFRTRRNHAIEHATIHVLTARSPKQALAGRADRHGFHIYGEVATEEVRSAALEAIDRLKTEPELAVHPFCGTNLVVGGVIAGFTSLLALATLPESRRPARPLDVLPRLMLAGTAAMLASQAVGSRVQEHVTTCPDTTGVRLGGIERHERGRHILHRVAIDDDLEAVDLAPPSKEE
jgi:hypothetical protein